MLRRVCVVSGIRLIVLLFPGLVAAGFGEERLGRGGWRRVTICPVAGLVGGKAETDWAWAAAPTPASNPNPKTADLNKLGIPRFSGLSMIRYKRL